jgi:hypothetical protein
MNNSNSASTRKAWSWLIAGVLVVAVVTGSLLYQHRGNELWQSSAQVTVTAFRDLRVASPSSDPTAVILTHAQSRRLDELVAALPNAGEADCLENSAVFTISVASRVGDTSHLIATDWACPAPGVLALQTSSGPRKLVGDVCTLRSFIDQIFPGNKAEGAKAELRQGCH